MRIGVIGAGVVGGALIKWLKDKTKNEVYVYDPAKGFEDDLSLCDATFICVPVPTNEDGSQDTSILDEVIGLARGVTFIRSTVIVGTNDQYDTFSCPEFLTERVALSDMSRMDVICGYPDEQFMQEIFPNKKIHFMENVECEIAKYAHNCFGAMKVNFFNIIYDICKREECNYDRVLEGVLMSGYINKTHTQVPGPDGQFGFGGACLVPETKILLNDEIVEAKNIKLGDIVSSHSGFTQVTKVGRRWVDNLIEIDSRGRKLIGSRDHIHLVYKNNKIEEKLLKDISLDDWVIIKRPEIDGIKSVHLGDKPNGYVKTWHNSIQLEDKILRVAGLYIAEGCMVDEKYTICWSFGEKKERLADEVVETLKGYGVHASKKLKVSKGTYGISKCYVVRTRSFWLTQLFNKLGLGRGAFNKSCPLLSGENALSLISGWLDGDGCINSGTVSGYSRSKTLINRIDSMLLSVGICATLKNNGEEIRISMKDDVRKITSYTKRLKIDESRYAKNHSYASPNMKVIDIGYISKIKSVRELSGSEVISIETSSQMYVANNFLTHNCFPKDLKAFNYKYPTLSLSAVITENRTFRHLQSKDQLQ